MTDETPDDNQDKLVIAWRNRDPSIQNSPSAETALRGPITNVSKLAAPGILHITTVVQTCVLRARLIREPAAGYSSHAMSHKVII
jgi:hypothetical protein